MLGQFASRVGGPDVRSICVPSGLGLMLGHFPSRVGGATVGSICVSSGRKDVQSIAI